MSTMSDQPETRVAPTEVRGRVTDTWPDSSDHFGRREHKVRETRASLATTEFWMTLGGIAALIVVYLVADDETLDLFRTAMLATIIGAAYVLSRGFAKSGARNEKWIESVPTTRYDTAHWGDAPAWREPSTNRPQQYTEHREHYPDERREAYPEQGRAAYPEQRDQRMEPPSERTR